MAKVRRWDSAQRVELLPYQAPEVMTRFSWISPSAFASAMQLVRNDGTTWQGAAALEELLGVLPRGRWIAWVFSVPFVRPIADKLYRWFARHRHRLGCGVHCRVS